MLSSERSLSITYTLFLLRLAWRAKSILLSLASCSSFSFFWAALTCASFFIISSIRRSFSRGSLVALIFARNSSFVCFVFLSCSFSRALTLFSVSLSSLSSLDSAVFSQGGFSLSSLALSETLFYIEAYLISYASCEGGRATVNLLWLRGIVFLKMS